MVKKLNPSSMKISKQDEKKQLNSLVKVLRPRVYITDSSSFKKLVQELTGLDQEISPTLSPPPPNLPMPSHHHVEIPPVIDVQDYGIFPESTSFELDSLDSGNDSFAKHEEFSDYRDIESWLLEIDQFQTHDSYMPLSYQEVCVYDYDLSGFI